MFSLKTSIPNASFEHEKSGHGRLAATTNEGDALSEPCGRFEYHRRTGSHSVGGCAGLLTKFNRAAADLH